MSKTPARRAAQAPDHYPEFLAGLKGRIAAARTTCGVSSPT
ncbi:MAG TPA: hypothetical protein VIH71_17965 [Solirubrobacteraceae bacterium]